jgi:hypothetical protein
MILQITPICGIRRCAEYPTGGPSKGTVKTASTKVKELSSQIVELLDAAEFDGKQLVRGNAITGEGGKRPYSWMKMP